MTSKEKALKLFKCFLIPTSRHYEYLPPLNDFEAAQECALIVVDEVLDELQRLPLSNSIIHKKIDFWIQVRVELEMLSFKEFITMQK